MQPKTGYGLRDVLPKQATDGRTDIEQRLVDSLLRLPQLLLRALRQNHSLLFECFPYACPEPVLVKRWRLVQNDAETSFCLPGLPAGAARTARPPPSRGSSGVHLC